LHCIEDVFIMVPEGTILQEAPQKGGPLKREIECDNGIWGHELKEQLCLRTEWTFDETFRKTMELEIEM
jgi:hypothetical protein